MKDKVYVAVPMHDGRLCCQTAQSLLAGYRWSRKDVDIGLTATSLLARNFNSIFKHAWNHGFKYVVILHADIGVHAPAPNQSWIDLLVNKVKMTGAAAISAVVPIKTEAGVTSTGLDLIKGNPYSMKRLTVRECNNLLGHRASLIMKDDICQLWGLDPKLTGPMLINTACLCMNLEMYNWGAIKWPGFTIEDVLGWSQNGITDIFTQPEDWHFSRWLDEINWPYYATCSLGIDHFGMHSFSNRGSWGLLRDLTPVQPSLLEFENGTCTADDVDIHIRATVPVRTG